MRSLAIESFRRSELEGWIDHAVDECDAVTKARKVPVLRRVRA
ncbi:hypothetical protein BSY16_2296 [Sinorhizobium sp. RAC02]|nr:hypothetical protein BSY16_2296 [Sinorhizobium sp. RAC02]